MESEHTNHLQQALIRDINGLLEYEGMVLPDREIIIPPALVQELDAIDIVIGRNEALRRTVCHVHRPPDDDYYWRHETFVAWDDGRTAQFKINIALDESEQGTMRAFQDAGFAFFGELERLKSRYVIDAERALAIEESVFNELKRIKTDVEDELLTHDELLGGSSAAVVEEILQMVEARVPLDAAPRPEFDDLYKAIHMLRRAQYEAIALRERIGERYLVLCDRALYVAELDNESMAPPIETWNLLQLLDKIR
jgi:hypothetical protein